jgi:hypothetical protein
MKITTCIIFSLFLFSGCTTNTISGSGKIETNSLAIEGFTKVKIGSSFDAEIVRAEQYSVQVSFDDNLKDYIEVVKRGDVLRIGKKPSKRVSFKDCTLQAKIGMPRLEGLRLSGAADVKLGNFISDLVAVQLSGAASLAGSLVANRLEVELSGASEIMLSGDAQHLELGLSGASQAELKSLTTLNADVDISGASQAEIYVTDKLNFSVSGASTLRYKGNPKFGKSHTSGSSKLTQM